METKMPPRWKGAQWEYQLQTFDPSEAHDRITGALDPAEHVHAIASEGLEGWEAVSVQAGERHNPRRPGQTKPVIIVLFKRPRPAKE